MNFFQFHDLVLDPLLLIFWFQAKQFSNCFTLCTLSAMKHNCFFALFSRRKVSIDELIILKNKFLFICIEFIGFIKKTVFLHSILLMVDFFYIFLKVPPAQQWVGGYKRVFEILIPFWDR